MNDLVRFYNGVQLATNQKKRGRKPIFNARQFYPYKEELRLKQALKKEIERFINEAYNIATRGVSFSDDIQDLTKLNPEPPEDFLKEVQAVGRSINQNVANAIVKSSEMIIGKPYYPPEVKQSIFTNWAANFQMLCVSAETDAKKEISRIVAQATNEGWNGKQLEKEIKGHVLPQFQNRAELIARTETAKLNSETTRATYKEIGIKYYMWLSTADDRTRTNHLAMDGKICDVDNPNIYYEETPEGLIEKTRDGTMVHLHPGEDFQCRCTMVEWDPAIDGQYEIKENKEAEEREKEEAEKAKEEEAKEKAKEEELTKATERAEKAEKRATEAERRAKILQQANERHAKRSEGFIEKIKEAWNNRKDERAGLIPKVKIDKKISQLSDNKMLIDYMKNKHGIEIKGISNYKTEHIKGAFEGIDAVLNIFNDAKVSSVKSFTSKKALMQARVLTNTRDDFKCGVEISSFFHHKDSKYVYKDGSFHPKNLNARSSAEHEMGHIVNYWIARLDGNVFQYENIAKDIVIESIKRTAPNKYIYNKASSNPYRLMISEYADREYKFTETIAESFADVFENRSKASNLSKIIYNVVYERAKKAGLKCSK